MSDKIITPKLEKMLVELDRRKWIAEHDVFGWMLVIYTPQLITYLSPNELRAIADHLDRKNNTAQWTSEEA
jgi:hypothetical protein